LTKEFESVQVVITCKHGGITPETEAHIKTKSEKLLTYFERVTAIGVTISFDDHRCKVEILVDAEHKHNFVASHEGENTPQVFDQALHKMEQQIRKYKEKIQDHRRDISTNEATTDTAGETD